MCGRNRCPSRAGIRKHRGTPAERSCCSNVERHTWTLIPKVMTCDTWLSPRENLRAIWQAIEGLRAIERSGASSVFERAYASFNALPPGEGAPAPSPVKRSWREVLGFTLKVATLYDVKKAYHALSNEHHPDKHGGSNAKQVELNEAWEEAKKEIAA